MSVQPSFFKVSNHSNQGLDFESELETTHDWYRRQGLADVRKIPNSWKFISFSEYQKLLVKLPPSHLAQTADGKCLQRVKSDVDFSGAGENFGISFDAKTCRAKNFPLSNIADHQLYKLKDRDRCGVIAGVMVYLGLLNRVFFVPYKYLEHRQTILLKQRGRRAQVGTASISLSDFEKNTVEIFRHTSNFLWDWCKYLVKT